MPDERNVWNERYRNGCPPLAVPNHFLVDAYSRFVEPRFPHPGTALDLAGGAGRHAIWLAERGWQVTLMDISSEGLALARKNAGEASARIEFLQADLRSFQAEREFDVVLVFYYLERAILAQLERSLRPGGVLLYKTYVRDEASSSSTPRNPAHLLEPGELPRLFPGLRVLHYRESRERRAVAELVATKG
jgi:2-polyprenyl-3-methyl-5-hydroxy-6-metoxy-1,4-benzoquinol methylase